MSERETDRRFPLFSSTAQEFGSTHRPKTPVPGLSRGKTGHRLRESRRRFRRYGLPLTQDEPELFQGLRRHLAVVRNAGLDSGGEALFERRTLFVLVRLGLGGLRVGTLVEEDGVPYLIFCHEWLQTKVGEICSVKLKENLSGPDGEPKVLFKASDSKWAKSPAWGSKGIIVTDGPFCLSIDGHNALIWSSYDERGTYVTGASYPAGKFHCPNYIQSASRPFLKNAGHGMCFRDFDGRWRFIAHQEGGIHEFPIIKSISLDSGKVVLA